jgi:hypothetical protein
MCSFFTYLGFTFWYLRRLDRDLFICVTLTCIFADFFGYYHVSCRILKKLCRFSQIVNTLILVHIRVKKIVASLFWRLELWLTNCRRILSYLQTSSLKCLIRCGALVSIQRQILSNIGKRCNNIFVVNWYCFLFVGDS